MFYILYILDICTLLTLDVSHNNYTFTVEEPSEEEEHREKNFYSPKNLFTCFMPNLIFSSFKPRAMKPHAKIMLSH